MSSRLMFRWLVAYPLIGLVLLSVFTPRDEPSPAPYYDARPGACELAMARARYVVAQGGVTTPAMLDYVQAECVR